MCASTTPMSQHLQTEPTPVRSVTACWPCVARSDGQQGSRDGGWRSEETCWRRGAEQSSSAAEQRRGGLDRWGEDRQHGRDGVSDQRAKDGWIERSTDRRRRGDRRNNAARLPARLASPLARLHPPSAALRRSAAGSQEQSREDPMPLPRAPTRAPTVLRWAAH